MLLRRRRENTPRTQMQVRVSPAPPTAPQSGPPRPKGMPEELLRRLQFKVLRRLDGFLFGEYTGRFFGPSLDLAEVREYQPGDEVRRIDWNVTARTGVIHVRQYREEREITAWVVVDLSASMNFGTRRQLKRDLALEFAAAAGSIVIRHGDKVGAIGLGAGGMQVVRPGSGRRQVLQMLHGLYDASVGAAAKAAPLEDALEHLGKTLRKKALIFVVSDYLSVSATEEPPWATALRRLAFRHDVVAVRVSDPAERELPKAGELRMRDPESGQEIWIDTSDPRVRAAHARLVESRDHMLERVFRSAQVDSFSLSTHQDLLEPLLKFAARRKGRR